MAMEWKQDELKPQVDMLIDRTRAIVPVEAADGTVTDSR